MIHRTCVIAMAVMIVTVLMCSNVASGLNQIRLGCPVTMNPIVPGDSVSIPVYITNDVALGGFSFGFEWNDPYVKISSADMTGSALNAAQVTNWHERYFGGDTLLVAFGWVDQSGARPLAPHLSEVLLFTINVVVLDGVTPFCVDIDSTFIPPAIRFVFARANGQSITPNFVDCFISEITLGDVQCRSTNASPIAICHDVTVSCDSTCHANAWVDNGSFDPDSEDVIVLRQTPPGPYLPGDTLVSLIATDNYGAADTCQAIVHVEAAPGCPKQDYLPVALCRDVLVSADSTCHAYASIDGGSYDPDSGGTVTLVQYPPGPYLPGDTLVYLIATDDYGAADTCQAVVHVVATPDCPEQDYLPVALCRDVLVSADSTCHAYASIDSGSYDPDSASTITLVQDPPGPYPAGCTRVTLYVTDRYGALAQCQANVHVQGSTSCPEQCFPPVALCRDVFVDADSTCRASASIDNGSYDPDLGSSITLTQYPHGPYGVGNTPAWLTVTDNFGRSSQCSAVIHVRDAAPPVISCPSNILRQVITGQTGRIVHFGVTATDACKPAPSVVATPPSGSFFPVGTTLVTATATDAAGNADTCQFNVQINEVAYICGDADSNADVDISDVVYLICYIYSGGQAPSSPEAGDTNCDQKIDIVDVVYLISYIFTGGPAPCAECD